MWGLDSVQQSISDRKSLLAINEELPARAEHLRAFIQIGYGMIGISLGRKGNQRNKKGASPRSQYLKIESVT